MKLLKALFLGLFFSHLVVGASYYAKADSFINLGKCIEGIQMMSDHPPWETEDYDYLCED